MLKLDSVKFNYETQDFEFDFDLAGGRCMAVMGESGSGKSTLLNLIAGFLTPRSGAIYYGNQRIDQLAPHQRPLTILFQEHNLFNHLNVYQNIGLGIRPSLKLNESEKQSIHDALNKVNLAGTENRLPESLSGGQRQRVAIARCLVRSRPILLLDEPFGGLNEELKSDIKVLLNQLKKELNLAMLWVTHDPDDVEGIVDEAMRLEHGKIITLINKCVGETLTAPATNLKDNPRNQPK